MSRPGPLDNKEWPRLEKTWEDLEHWQCPILLKEIFIFFLQTCWTRNVWLQYAGYQLPIAIVHLLASSWAEFHGDLGRYLGPHGKLGYSSAGIRSLDHLGKLLEFLPSPRRSLHPKPSSQSPGVCLKTWSAGLLGHFCHFSWRWTFSSLTYVMKSRETSTQSQKIRWDFSFSGICVGCWCSISLKHPVGCPSSISRCVVRHLRRWSRNYLLRKLSFAFASVLGKNKFFGGFVAMKVSQVQIIFICFGCVQTFSSENQPWTFDGYFFWGARDTSAHTTFAGLKSSLTMCRVVAKQSSFIQQIEMKWIH